MIINKNLEIYDTTLREGEQSAVANFDLKDRIEICKMLDDFGVDYIELGWPIASQEIFDSFKPCIEAVKKAKVVAFGSTSIRENPGEDENLNSIVESGVKVACIFGKSHLIHVEKQLKISAQENLTRIEKSVKYLKEKEIEVFYDAEHYFDAFKLHEDYAIETLVSAKKAGATRIILCDTNGGTLPDEAEKIVKTTKEKLGEIELGVHFHDDSGLALANTLVTLPYAKQIQGTINGIGERVGNLNLANFCQCAQKK
jgi:2-isopropylmalate synthase